MILLVRYAVRSAKLHDQLCHYFRNSTKSNLGMQILLLADIHSNWPALATIDEEFDACFFLGDLVDYATDPVPCDLLGSWKP